MIQLSHVSKRYLSGPSDYVALRDVSFTVAKGEMVFVTGHSGAGKSTLLRLINRLEEPSSGRIRVNGEDVTALDAAGLRRFRQRVGLIFQHFNLLSSATVADNVALPLRLAGELDRGQINQRVRALLERVGLSDHATSTRRSCPAARSSGSALPAPCPPSRAYCCATRPPAPSTPTPPVRCCSCWRRSIRN